jgi:hypothetical protein
VIEVRRNGERVSVITRGDAMRTDDGVIDQAQILGRVPAVEKNGRRVELDRGLMRVVGRLWMALSPATLCVLSIVTRIRAWASAAGCAMTRRWTD